MPLQTTYAEAPAAGLPGMVANSEPPHKITKTAAGNIGFGLPVLASGARGCILASQETLEVVAATAFAGNTGNGTMGTVTVSAGAKLGAYSLVIIEPGTNTGRFEVRDPDGNFVGVGTVASAFSAGGLAFTLADGSTDFVSGDGFLIPVTATAGTDVLEEPLGISIRDQTLVHSTVDRYESPDSVSILLKGVIFVTCGATVVAGDPVYWNPATARYTKTTTHLKIPGARFNEPGSNGAVITIRLAEKVGANA